MTNRRSVTRAGVVLGLALLILPWIAVERAGAELLGDFSLSPTSGPPGTVVTVSGDDCPTGLLLNGQDYVAVTATTLLPASVRMPVQANGSWQGTFTVPASAPALTALVAPVCVTDGLVPTPYTPRTFTVTAPAPPPTSPTSPPTTAPSSGGAGGSTTSSTSAAAGAKPGEPSSGSGGGAGQSPTGEVPGDQTMADPQSDISNALATEAQTAGLRSPTLARDAAADRAAGLAWMNWLLFAVLAAGVAGAIGVLRSTRLPRTGHGPGAVPGTDET